MNLNFRIQKFYSLLNNPILDRSKLEELCFNGIPEESGDLKALCWKILLDYLPLTREDWGEHLHRQRELYKGYITLLFQTPDFGGIDTSADSTKKKRRGSTPIDTDTASSLTSGFFSFFLLTSKFSVMCQQQQKT